jgi:hypothetical protein
VPKRDSRVLSLPLGKGKLRQSLLTTHVNYLRPPPNPQQQQEVRTTRKAPAPTTKQTHATPTAPEERRVTDRQN